MSVTLNPSPESAVADRILGVAKSILADVGEAGLRIDDVMEGASVQAPVIYRHFGSREGLVQSAYLARHTDNVLATIRLFAANSIDAADETEFRAGFDNMMDVIFSGESVEIALVRLEVFAAGLKRPELAGRLSEGQAIAVETPIAVLEMAQAKGWIRPDINVREFVFWAISATLGQAAVARYRREPESAKLWADNHLLAVRAVLFGASS